ncbi:aldo/keto reductase [Bacteroidota bacterium]
MKDISRRDFIKVSAVTGAAIASGSLMTGCCPYNAKDIPVATLGKTGVHVPRMAIGLGSRWCAVSDEDTALEILNYAFDNGLYYWDTAWSYTNEDKSVISEERVGKLLKDRREKVFISTKVASREPDEAKRQIEESLKRLQVDHVDMLKIHSIQGNTPEDQEGESRIFEVIQKMKEEGITRFIGFSGHSEDKALKRMIDNYDFDSMLFALNHWNASNEWKREDVIPAANEKGMGVMLMKLIRSRENDPTLTGEELIRYGLSIKGATGVIVGMDNLDVVKSNIEILKNFAPMDQEEFNKMTARLAPFYRHQNLPWMESGYQDGHWS